MIKAYTLNFIHPLKYVKLDRIKTPVWKICDAFEKSKGSNLFNSRESFTLSRNFTLFFIQNEHMRDFIFPEEIYKYIKEQEDFKDYDEESLYLDLDQLVKWGNLLPRQEMRSSKTIEEYKRAFLLPADSLSDLIRRSFCRGR